MFTSLHTEVLDRFNVTREHFRATCNPGSPAIAATSRGMCFVQMYAAWEFTVKTSVAAALESSCKHGMPFAQTRLELTALLLHGDFKSISDSGRETFWKRTLQTLRKTASDAPATAAADAFPTDNSHFRIAQIYLIWDIFGIKVPVVPSPRLMNLVGEVGENRNAIAHGRRTPNDVGRGYSIKDIEHKIDGMQEICVHVASTLELHCSLSANLAR